MPEQIKNVLDKVVEWWKKFSTRQRIFMISITAVLILALIILYVVVSRPEMVKLYEASDSKEAAQIREVLDSDSSIDYKIENDNLTFSVDKKDEANASMLLGSNDFPSKNYSIESVTIPESITSFSTAFQGCYGIKVITFPRGVSSMTSYAE